MTTTADRAKPAFALPRMAMSLPMLAGGIAVTTIVAALIFRTYEIAMPSQGLEGLRQLGIVFLLFETGVILLAMARGLEIADVVRAQSRPVQVLLAIFFATFLWGGIVNAPNPAWASVMSLTAPFHVVFAFAVAHCVGRIDSDAVARFGNVVAVGMAIYTAILAVVFFTPPSGLEPSAIRWHLAVPGFISHRLLGAFTGALAAFFVARYIIQREEGGEDWWSLAAIILLLGLTIWTGTRAALLGLAVSMPILLLHGLPWPKLRQLAVLLLCVGIAFAVAQVLIPYDSVHFKLFASGDVESADAVSGGRLVYWAYVVDAIAAHPWIGSGSSASIWILPDEAQQHVQPHNVFLQFLLSWGLLGGVAALAILAIFVWRIHRLAARSTLALPFLAVVDCLLVISLVDGMFHFARHFMLMMLCAGIILAIARQSRGVDMGTDSA